MDFFKVRTTSPYCYMHTYARVHILASSFFEKDHHTFGYKNYSNFREVRQVFIGFNWMNFQFVL